MAKSAGSDVSLKLFPTDLKFEFLEHPVLLKTSKGDAIACDVCCMIVDGSVYFCEKKGHWVHQACAMQEDKILLVMGEESTELELRKGEAKSKCVKCKALKPKGSQGKLEGFCYESPSGDLTFHVSCFNNARDSETVTEISGSARSLKLFPAHLMFKFMEKPVLPKTFKGEHHKYGIACDVCYMIVEGSNYHCEEKGIYVHHACAMLKKNVVVIVDKKPIEFELKEGEAKSKCVKCNALKPKGSLGDIKGFRYESLSGDLTFHVSCFNDVRDSEAFTEISGSAQSLKLFPAHLMFKFMEKPVLPKTYKGESHKYGIACDVCYMIVKGSNYHCEEKDIYVHHACAMLKKKVVVTVDKKRIDFELKEGEAKSKCVKCNALKPKGSLGDIKGFRYESLSWDLTFHVSCFNDARDSEAFTEISGSAQSLKLFPAHLMFKFMEKLVLPKTPKGDRHKYGIACDVCYMIVEGSNYHCEEKGIYVHHACAMLKKNVVVIVDKKPIEFELKEGEAKSKCVKCNALKPKGSHGDIKGFRYESLSGDLTFHVSCFLDNSAIQKPNKRDQAIKLGDGVVSKVVDAMVDEVFATILPALLGDFSPIVSVVLKGATVLLSSSSKKKI